MPNIGAVLKEEIARLSRREIRKQVEPLRKAAATHRRDIAALKHQLVALQRYANALAKHSGRAERDASSSAPEPPLRFVAKGLRSLRTRLGLSAPNLAQLMCVSTQTIYNWEHKKANPRKEQLTKLAALRSLGKREAQARLEALHTTSVRKRRKTSK
jgi:DNA-binding transcriptional regulator YiaG